MNITLPGMITSIQVGELSQEGARIFGIWVEENVVDEVGNEIYNKHRSQETGH
jgi:hypothetical protein